MNISKKIYLLLGFLNCQIFLSHALLADVSCRPVDIIFVVDGSASVGPENFLIIKDWLKSTTAHLQVQFGEKAQQAVIQYSHMYPDEDVHNATYVKAAFRLGECSNDDCFEEKIDNMIYMGYTTYTNYALRVALEVEFPHSTRYGSAKKIIVLLTDGRAIDSEELPTWYLNSQVEDVTSYVIGAGDFVNSELQVIANGGVSDERVFNATFSSLPDLTLVIAEDNCYDYTTTVTAQTSSFEEFHSTSVARTTESTISADVSCRPVDIIFVVDGSGSIGSGFHKIKDWLKRTTAHLQAQFGEKAQQAVIQYSHMYPEEDIHDATYVEAAFRLGECSNDDCFEEKLDNMTLMGYTTYTNFGLRVAMEVEFPHSTRYGSAKKTIVLLTDGRADDSEELPTWYLNSQVENVTSYVIGVGAIDMSELQIIANGGVSDDRVFTTPNFSSLPDLTPIITEDNCYAYTTTVMGTTENNILTDTMSPALPTSPTATTESITSTATTHDMTTYEVRETTESIPIETTSTQTNGCSSQWHESMRQYRENEKI